MEQKSTGSIIEMCRWCRSCYWPSTSLLETCLSSSNSARQCTSTSRSRHSGASAPWNTCTPGHQFWHVASQRCRHTEAWSLWTLAVTLLAWHLSCHASQPALFWATNDTQQIRLFSEPSTFGGKQYTFIHMNKFCISQGSVVTLFRCGGQVHSHS